MTGVPGGDVTLHAAITETVAMHRPAGGFDVPMCSCKQEWEPAHVTDRVLAVLADRLPHTPPDQLAGLIGGTVRREYGLLGPANAHGLRTRPDGSRLVGPWVPDSPPAAPEPRQDT